MSSETLGSALRGRCWGKINREKQSLVAEYFCAVISCSYELILKQSGCLFLLHSFLRAFGTLLKYIAFLGMSL